MKHFLGLSLAGLLMGIAAEVRAGDGCDQCGCGEVRKVCKVQCGTKKVTKTVWGCKCEDVCLPGYIKGGDCCQGGHCGGGLKGLFSKHRDRCDGCVGGCDGISCGGRCRDVAPGDVSHCQVRSRKKLIRYEIEEEVPVYEWKVEYACGCGAGCCDLGSPGSVYGGPSPAASPPVEPPPVDAQREAPPPPPPFDAARTNRSLLRTVFR